MSTTDNHLTCTKYPRTEHVSWSKGVSSDDKIKQDLSNFEGKICMVSLKLDGEATTFYPRYGLDGIHARSLDSAVDWTREWCRSVQVGTAHLYKNKRICGENMAAIHSITYDNLDSFFYIYSIWDEETNCCLSWEDTVKMAEELDLPTVEVLYYGIWDEKLFEKMFEDLDKEKNEGLTIRLAESFHYDDFSDSLVKAVREGHVQTDEHWRKKAKPAKLADENNVRPKFMNKKGN